MGSIFANLGIDWKLFLAQTFNFLLVLFLLKKFIYPKLMNFIEEREKKIRTGLELTDRMEREIERVEVVKKRELDAAKIEAKEIVKEAKILAQGKKETLEGEAKKSAEKIVLQAKMQAEREKIEAVMGAKGDISKAALLAAEKILSRNIAKPDEEKAVQEVLDYMKENYASN